MSLQLGRDEMNRGTVGDVRGASRTEFHQSIVILLAMASIAVALGVCAAGDGPVEIKLPPDLVFDKAKGSAGAVVFSHQSHAALADNKCTGCHPQPFSILHTTRRVTHADMNAGRACGTCHDGKSATGTTDGSSCTHCHAAVPGDVALTIGEGSPGPVTFRHATHGGEKAQCGTCHPRPFAMKARATVLVKDDMLTGQTCGACHDGRRSFAVDDGAACDRCHATKGAHP